ncbi:glycosyltransferase family 2 protein [Aliivibrio sp. S3MY1]|uniref:glycosyltransferase family 2 protein n=1 Tax=unclassified Aliivibrio TaxID=2645654 RepID=UPI002377F057|nr:MULTISPECIES: glycosyltransferase family 2 protein [unclassified Aliivibrio]MDD9196711.1 glycosyltransferase family 2 protein [Aliivibrio sp. S3MY1]MDD9199798.1 glycosyltransferase family 2 protein [Aliivibrio sp. S2MY1]
MNKELVTVVTVCYNVSNDLNKTLQSVINQSYENIECVIIDGGSSDCSVDIIKKYESIAFKNNISFKWISEPDNGIYDAMNKGISLAKGKWINFMNAGDLFNDKCALESALKYSSGADLIYSDTLFSNGRVFICQENKNRIIHQSLIYKKSLHNEFGLYLNSKGITISDYLFFQSCKAKNWYKTDVIIAKCDSNGVSSHLEHFKQKIAIDIMFKNIGRIQASFILLLHPIYNKVKSFLLTKGGRGG